MVGLWCTLLQVFSYRCSLKTKSFMKCIIGSLSVAILIKLPWAPLSHLDFPSGKGRDHRHYIRDIPFFTVRF